MRHEAMSFVWADDCMYDMKITHWMKSGGDNNGMKTVVIIFMDFSMVDSYTHSVLWRYKNFHFVHTPTTSWQLLQSIEINDIVDDRNLFVFDAYHVVLLHSCSAVDRKGLLHVYEQFSCNNLIACTIYVK